MYSSTRVKGKPGRHSAPAYRRRAREESLFGVDRRAERFLVATLLGMKVAGTLRNL
jgi:hypothetical protein